MTVALISFRGNKFHKPRDLINYISESKIVVKYFKSNNILGYKYFK